MTMTENIDLGSTIYTLIISKIFRISEIQVIQA